MFELLYWDPMFPYHKTLAKIFSHKDCKCLDYVQITIQKLNCFVIFICWEVIRKRIFLLTYDNTDGAQKRK